MRFPETSTKWNICGSAHILLKEKVAVMAQKKGIKSGVLSVDLKLF